LTPHNSDIEIRQLIASDAALSWQLRLIALETDPAAFLETAEQHRASSVSMYRERLRMGPPDHVVFGAFKNDALIGMVGFGRDYGDPDRAGRIWGMFVLPNYRGLGVGRRLLGAVVTHARTLAGLEIVQLEVAPSQHAAWNLYTSCGFRVEEETTGSHQVMTLKLNNGNAEECTDLL
jgi:ribosomal protein S18 acetylase RimI-like enzyme